MVSVWVATVLAIGASVAGGVGAYILRSRFEAKKLKEAQERAAQIVAETQEQGKKAQTAAKEEALKLRSEAEMDIRRHRAEVQKLERRVMNREENLERRYEALEKKEHILASKEQDVDAQRTKMEQLHQEELVRLEKLSGLSQQEVRDLILQKTEQQMQEELARRYWEKEQAMKEEAGTKARKIITTAIQRLASDVVSETTVSVIPIPNDEMKGRLIGREGRNIRALENATGVELIVDDTPEAVTLSCFDPVRREIARVAVTKLISDGRIHPARIEEVVNKAQEEVDETIRKAGEQAVYDSGVGGLNPELIKLLGRLKYRYSYGHNVLNHCVEVALLSGMMAAEIGANAKVARAGGLLHDIGKALTHEVEGTHAEIGADVARKYGIAPEIYRAIMEHHDEEMSSVEAHLVACADAISGARPGARKDTFEQYVKRLTALENVANSFEGVEKCYAIQAGREIRIMVKPHQIDDPGAAQLAREVAKKIQKELVFPGQIKVVVIRETRSVEIAK